MSEQNRFETILEKKRNSTTFDIGLTKSTMKELRIRPGDIVSITGTRMTAAVAKLPTKKQDDNVVSISSRIIANAGTAISGYVSISKASTQRADYLRLIPTNVPFNPDTKFNEFVGKKLDKKPVVTNDTVYIPILGRGIPFKVTESEPNGIVVVNKKTEIDIYLEISLFDEPERSIYDVSAAFSLSVSKAKSSINTLRMHIDSGKIYDWLDQLEDKVDEEPK